MTTTAAADATTGDASPFGHQVSDVVDGEVPLRLRRAERVLRGRVRNVTLVLEKFSNELNMQAVLRTAEAMGVQNVFLVKPTLLKRPASKQKERKKGGKDTDFAWGPGIGITSGCERWLTCSYFDTTAACVEQLRSEGHAIWATDLSKEAVCLDGGFAASPQCPAPLPEKVALVMGSEAEGVSREMLDAAALRVYLPMYGFTDSYNVGVASALAVHCVLGVLGRTALTEEQQAALRGAWRGLLSSNPTIAAALDGYAASGGVPPPLDDLREGRANPEGPRIIKKVLRRQQEVERQKKAEEEGGAAAAPAPSSVVCKLDDEIRSLEQQLAAKKTQRLAAIAAPDAKKAKVAE
eukprot:Rhum_TRINITY_DN9515_c0_g1::Rhum_TRINITY_DN9515_c0_g1_i1::g.33873::m.33873